MANEEIREQNKERVLLAAYESFLSEGIEKTTQAMIAHKTGLSLRTVTRYFTSKDQMVLLVSKYVLNANKEESQNAPEKLREMGKSGIELLELYFSFIKSAFYNDPRVFLLRAEFDIYFYRSKVYDNDIYKQVVAEVNCRPLLREILSKGIEDGTIKCSDDLDFEVRHLSNTYWGFLSAFAIKSVVQMEAENIKGQFDQFFKRLLNQYKS